MPTYLEQLTIRIAEGVGRLPDDERRRHTQYFLAAQRADGGFGGREGGSDLYYTGFALRGLAVLGELYGEVAQRVAAFLQSRLGGQESVVDFFSLIYGGMLLKSTAGVDVFANSQAAWREQVAAWLETLRRADGGYAKGVEGQASSTYHSFLVVICLQLLDKLPPEPERLLAFLKSQLAEEGGFREIKVGKRAGTNPTAAAIATFRIPWRSTKIPGSHRALGRRAAPQRGGAGAGRRRAAGRPRAGSRGARRSRRRDRGVPGDPARAPDEHGTRRKRAGLTGA